MFYMYVRLTKSKKSKNPTLQIVRGIRRGKKVKQKIVASLGVIKSKKDLIGLSKLVEHLIHKLEQEGLPINDKVQIDKFVHRKTFYDGFGQVVDKLFELSEFSKIAKQAQGRCKFNLEEILKLIITQRLDLPSSKLRTYERQNEHGFYGIELQNIYRAMDIIEPFNELFQKKAFEITCKHSLRPINCFFFDVTTLYFESIQQDEIRDFGFSKDQKNHSVQIVLALVVDEQGMPIAYEAFKGNLAETKTLIPVLKSLRKRFSITKVIVVCDRGLASLANVLALTKEGFQYVTATKLRSISKNFHINDLSKYAPLPNQNHLSKEEKILFRSMDHPQYENALLIATYSPKRARKDKKNREQLIEKLQKKLVNSKNATSVKKVISNAGYKKFLNVIATSQITLNQDAIQKDAVWDGFHGIAVSKDACLKPIEALSCYRDLWHVEETFRIAKNTLKTRPIFHWIPRRIRSHILLCFITLFLERFLELQLRNNQNPMTPEKIRYALSNIHTTVFENIETKQKGKMQSTLSEDAKTIFQVLGLVLDRKTTLEKKEAKKQ